MPTAAMSPPAEVGMDADIKMEDAPDPKPALTPPTSEGTNKKNDDSDSELSELDPEDEPPATPKVAAADLEGIHPHHYSEDGGIPIFKPTMDQFRSFKDYIDKINVYGMKSGIVKVIPPEEWRNTLPSLDEQVKTIRVKNPITQEFHGTHGTYTQANIEKQRSYNLPQWKALCEESNHQPPAKRGERRRNQERPTRGTTTRAKNTSAAAASKEPKDKKKPGRPGRPKSKIAPAVPTLETEEDGTDGGVQVPPTPTSPPLKATKGKRVKKEQKSDDEGSKPRGRQPKSVSSRRQHNKQSQADYVDEEAFKDFEYGVDNQDEWTAERCQELETAYWKSLTFNNPMYGADMPGSLFDDSTTSWNVAKLENLLDVLGQKVPGVNTAYLYLGMWKASFAWHLEDVDLYSINYIHFGAPKQWYSISQKDARRFEAAMKNVWPSDAKNCDQFLRHKTYLISPQLLQSQYNIKVNRLVHNEGEFVITFPYGYHSGYNLGYNCAESVNFATESWLEYGRIAKKCNCEADSVWVDVRDIERKLRGEPTPEYYEETDDDEDEEEEEGPTDLPTPPGSVKGKPKRSHKRKRDLNEKDSKPKVKKLRIRVKAPSFEPCILCPNDPKHEELLPTDNGKMAHRLCGFYTPETYISDDEGSSKIYNVAHIDKARLDLKCQYCRSKKGSVFQCSSKKCTRGFHATCAAQAGVLVDIGIIPVFGEDGTEYTDEGIDFRCRFHRSKRGKNMDSVALEEDIFIRRQAAKIQPGETVQAQYFQQQEIFAGFVLENRKDEETLLLEVMPKGEIVEVDWKWLLVLDPLKSQRPVPSPDAKPLPAEMARNNRTTAEAPPGEDDPKTNDPFCDPTSIHKWSEFTTCKQFKNDHQVKINIDKPDKLWYFLGKESTEAKAQYTHDLAIRKNNHKANYMDHVRVSSLPPLHANPPLRRSVPAFYPAGAGYNQNAVNAARAGVQSLHSKAAAPAIKDRPYHGKYAITDPVSSYQYKPTNKFSAESYQPRSQYENASYAQGQQPQQFHHHHSYSNSGSGYQNLPAPVAPVMPGYAQKAAAQTYKAQHPFNYNYNFNYTQQPYQASTPQTPASYARQQAPVANMMGSDPQVTPISISKPAPYERRESVTNPPQVVSHPTPPHSARPSLTAMSSPSLASPTVPETKGVSHLDLPAKFLYLHNADKARPPVYQSPYAVGGGFTKPYLPAPEAPPRIRPRGPSMSESFLAKQDEGHQKAVAKILNEEKARLQQENNDRVQRRLSQSQAQRPAIPQHIPMSAIQDPSSNKQSQPTHGHGGSYNNSPPDVFHQSYSHYSPSYPTNNYQRNGAQGGSSFSQQQHSSSYQTPYNNPSPTPSYPAKPSGLQFSSPQDFRQQMESASQRPQPHDQGYQKLWSEMQSAAGDGNNNAAVGGGHGHQASESGGGGGGGGGQGSPLKYEMGGGGETLPMMREGSRF